MSLKQEILRLERITTDYKGVRILKDARMNLFYGEITGILGVNYSGKTALAGAVCGFFPCNSGEIYFMGEKVHITSILQARNMGIFYIHQESTLVEEITVFDNFMLSFSSRSIWIRNRRKKEEDIRDILAIFDAEDIDIYAEARTLSEYQRLVVEVSRAVLNGVRVIFFDGVLSNVSFNIEKRVNKLLEQLENMNICIVLIEAKQMYLKQWCDRIFVMRSGRTVGVLERSTDEEKFVSLMMGYPAKLPLKNQGTDGISGGEKGLLVLTHVNTPTGLNDLSLAVYEEEITGVLFLEKESQKALEGLLEGKTKNYSGRILYQDRPLMNRNTDQMLMQGVVFIQEDNLYPEMSLDENILISAYKTTSHGIMLNNPELKYVITELITRYFSEYGDLHNKEVDRREDWLFRKKIMLCRGIATSPKLMIFVNPTVHSDLSLRKCYYEDVLSIKKYGISALILSTDLEELLALCDRIIIVQNGKAIEQYPVDKEGSEALKNKFSVFLKDTK